jgi:hypothetical protein
MSRVFVFVLASFLSVLSLLCYLSAATGVSAFNVSSNQTKIESFGKEMAALDEPCSGIKATHCGKGLRCKKPCSPGLGDASGKCIRKGDFVADCQICSIDVSESCPVGLICKSTELKGAMRCQMPA